MSVLQSYDAILRSIDTHGAWRRGVFLYTNEGSSAPTAAAGGLTQFKRFTPQITVPSMGGGILGMYLIQSRITNLLGQSGEGNALALEYELGSINLATGTFTAGVSMPTKRYSGKGAIQSASQITLLTISASLTAATPTIGVTYTNQDGTGGQTCSLVVPTNALVGSAYMLTPSLAAGDTGMRAVSAMTKSAGTVGTVKVMGYLFLADSLQSEASIEPMHAQYPLWLCEPGDKITVIAPTTRAISSVYATLVGVAET